MTKEQLANDVVSNLARGRVTPRLGEDFANRLELEGHPDLAKTVRRAVEDRKGVLRSRGFAALAAG